MNRELETDQRRENDRVYAFRCHMQRRAWWSPWYAKLEFQEQDDIDLFLCPWMDYALDAGLATSLGYTAAAWSRRRLDRKVEKAKREIMGI